MGSLTIHINNKAYTIACKDGQEERLRTLSIRLQARIEALAGQYKNVDDTHLLLLAALMLIEEAGEEETKKRFIQEEMREIALLKKRIHDIIQKVS